MQSCLKPSSPTAPTLCLQKCCSLSTRLATPAETHTVYCSMAQDLDICVHVCYL